MSSYAKTALQLALVVLIVGVFMRMFIIDTFIVRGDSMSPTIVEGDYVFVNKFAYSFGNEPERGDIIVTKFRTEKPNVIKRVIALPRERIEIRPSGVHIKTSRNDEGELLSEDAYRNLPQFATNGTTTINIDPGEYFVLGDNRFASTDSRELGAVDIWDLQGKVFATIRLSSLKLFLF